MGLKNKNGCCRCAILVVVDGIHAATWTHARARKPKTLAKLWLDIGVWFGNIDATPVGLKNKNGCCRCAILVVVDGIHAVTWTHARARKPKTLAKLWLDIGVWFGNIDAAQRA